jgi:hypothetical protein
MLLGVARLALWTVVSRVVISGVVALPVSRHIVSVWGPESEVPVVDLP